MDMNRDDLLLRGLADGATSPAALTDRTGLTLSSVKRGLRHLSTTGHVFSPARGTYRLTTLGATVLARPEQDPPAAASRSVDRADDRPPVEPRPRVIAMAASAATTPVAPQSSPARSSTAARPPFVVDGVLVPDDGLSHVIGAAGLVGSGSKVTSLERTPTSAPRAVATTDVVTTSVARPASPPRSSTAAPRPAPIGTAPSVDRLVDDRTAHDDTIAADAGTIGWGTVAAGALIIGAVGVAVWKGPAVLAALGTAGTPQHDEAPRQAAVDAPLDAPLEAMEYNPPAGMASASDLIRYGSGRGGIR